MFARGKATGFNRKRTVNVPHGGSKHTETRNNWLLVTCTSEEHKPGFEYLNQQVPHPEVTCIV